jgi:hypothetical protein
LSPRQHFRLDPASRPRPKLPEPAPLGLAVSWVTSERSPAPDQRLALPDRLPRSQSSFATAYRHISKHPLASLGATLGTVATVIGVSTGVSAAATSAPAVSPPAGQAAATTGMSSPLAAAQAASPLDSSGQGLSPLAAAAGQDITLGAAGGRPAATTRPQYHPSPIHLAVSEKPVAAGHLRQFATRHAAAAHPGVRSQAGRAAYQSRAVHQARAGHQGRAGHRTWQRQSAARKQWPYLIYDSVTPGAIPAHHVVATYATGPFAVSAGQVASRKAVVWIDTRGTDPQAAALDVEPGDATPASAADWAWWRLHTVPYAKAIIYTMRSEWPATEAAIATLPHWMQNHIRWWIADPTGYPHIVPGANATQWYWGTHYDITTANPGF